MLITTILDASGGLLPGAADIGRFSSHLHHLGQASQPGDLAEYKTAVKKAITLRNSASQWSVYVNQEY